LNAYKARHTLESWDAVIASLMPEGETGEA
jgi:hypothetical protein